jgi:hypothetical protein
MDFTDLDDWMHTYKPNIKERAGSMKSEGNKSYTYFLIVFNGAL